MHLLPIRPILAYTLFWVATNPPYFGNAREKRRHDLILIALCAKKRRSDRILRLQTLTRACAHDCLHMPARARTLTCASQEHAGHDEQRHASDKRHDVSGTQGTLRHMRPDSAGIATRVHCLGKLVGTVEQAHEQRNEYGNP